MKRLFGTLVILVFCCQNVFSQAPGCPSVDVGPDTTIGCSTSSCVLLSVDYFNVGQTSSYSVSSTPYTPPYPFTGGTQLFIGIDDEWSNIINMPFNFCFFGNTYNQIVIGTNGVISFDVSLAGGYCNFGFSNTIPNTTGEPYRNSINGAYHDIDPSIGGDINYAILGSYPCRTFVVNYNNVPHFSCNSITTTQQIVLYETTNVIEVYINDKPTCSTWNSGNAVIGIQNITGTLGYTPPNRNTGPWSTSNEAWRFTPSGPSICSVNWFESGVSSPISTFDTVTVCPNNTTTYIAEVTYTRCDSTIVIEKDTILINAGIQQENILDTIISCDTSITLAAAQAYTYLWSTGETTQSITVSQSGDYWVQICDSAFGEVLVYENDFDSFIGSEWSDNTTSTYNSTTVLGNFNNASTTLNLSNLPTHNSIKAVFDLYLLDSWDGNAGPDIWSLSIDGSSTINTTFANTNFGGGTQQSYPGNFPSANAPLTGVNQMGLPNICYTGINSISSMYKIDSPFSTHSATSANFDFSASGLESSCNESWAIDSVKIYVDGALSCCATEFVHIELTAPVANLGPDIITCDSLVTLTASGGYTYLWNTGDTTQSIVVDTTGNYQVEICDPVAGILPVYESNFGVGIDANWNTISSYSINGITALGQFSNETISLSLNSPLPHDSILVEFDLYLISSWDGNGVPVCCGPDFFTLRADGIDMMHTTFSIPGGACQQQSYPDDYPAANPSCVNQNASGAGWHMYSISKTIHHTNANAVIDFIGGPGLQSLGDESWAFSNVKTYTITNECCATEDINVQIKCPPTTVVITEPTCNSGADGSIDLTFVDGTLPQTVVWQNSNNTFLSNMPDITNLIAGEYIVSTTCGLTCSPVVDTIIVPDPPALIVPGLTSDVSCFGLNDGSIDITVSALIPLVLSTEWTGSNNFTSTLEDINNLPPGMYSVLVTDVNTCFLTRSFEIKEPDSILPNPTIMDVSCHGFFDGTVSLSITGGTTPYNVNWGTSNPLNLYAGTYTYSITDSNNCVFAEDVIISEPDPILPNPTTTDVLCYGDSTGTAVLSPTGGIDPYNINWGTSNPTSLPEGVHSYTITDANDCLYPSSIYISQPDLIVVFLTLQNVSCYGGFDGSASLSITGGVSPYSIDWGINNPLNLYAGTYLYSISDVNHCTFTDSVTITQPDSLKVTYITTPVQCPGESTGMIDVQVLPGSGIPPYQYSWSGPNLFSSSFPDISNLVAGIYVLQVTDENNCIQEVHIVVDEPTDLTQIDREIKSNYNGFHIACKGDNSGWIKLEITGGYIPYTYAWNTGETTDSISNLYAGIYNVIITDGLGCVHDNNYPLLEPPTNLTGVIQTTTDYSGFNISCFNGSDGGIREIPSGGVPPYHWVWSGTQGDEYLINQMAGHHYVELYDNNNCFWDDSITLTEPPPLDIQKMSVTDTCDRAVGEAYATNVTGGVPFLGTAYQYQWSSGDTLSIAVGLAEGNYNLIVTDDNGCTDTAWYDIANLKAPLIDFHTFPDHRRYYDQLDNPFFFIDISNAYWQNVVDWQWDFGDHTFGEDSIVSHSYAEAGEYTILLAIETQYNCWDTISKKILIDEYALYIPNAFTPFTGDVLNDEFKAYGYGIVNYTMKIYNRWGGMIFESDDINRGWDGTTRNGKNIAPIGVYLYYIAVENIYGEIFKHEGKLDLIR